MPLDRKKIHTIYSALKENGDYEADYSTFENEFVGNDNYENRKKVYDTLKRGGADIGSTYEDFMQHMQSKPKPASSSSHQKGKDVSPSDSEDIPSPQQPQSIKSPKNDAAYQRTIASGDAALGYTLPAPPKVTTDALKSPRQLHTEAASHSPS